MILTTAPENEAQREQDEDPTIGSEKRQSKSCIINEGWKRMTDAIHNAIDRFVLSLSLLAARNPKRMIVSITVVSFAMISAGFFTNFTLKVDYEDIYSPYGCLPLQDKEWIDNESGFPETPRPLSIILHNNGDNVLGRDQVDLLFEALDTVRGTPKYDEICQSSTYRNSNDEPDCKIFGATRFWDHQATTFHQEIGSDVDAVKAMSAETFPGGVPVYTEFLFGYAERQGGSSGDGESESGSSNGELLTSAKSYLLRIDIPNTEGVEDFEVELLDRLGELQKSWSQIPNNKLQLSYFTLMSYDIEFKRAIDTDLILVPFVVMIMSVFTMLVFYRSDRVQSRSLLGLGSVAAVGLSLMTGYGLMFAIGIPFTSMTQLLPFVVFGIGLDDTFIIMGAFLRTDTRKSSLERIEETMHEVGQSISLTTITTMSAFILGCISTIPAIQWVCIYAFPTIFINFVYQITIFVAFLVLDEERVKENRMDCCICIAIKASLDAEIVQEAVIAKPEDDSCRKEVLDPEEQEPEETSETEEEFVEQCKQPQMKGLNERFMSWYAKQLLRPWVKILIFAIFLGYFAFCAYCTTNLSQRFRTQDFVPEDSYVSNFLASLDRYSEQVMGINVYFRGVNQSDPDVQGEMIEYMHDLMNMPAVNGTKPPFCWFMDFEERKDDPIFDLVKDLSFSEKVSLALKNPSIREAYADDIVQNEDGDIVASRCWLNPKYLDMDVVNEQIDLLADQRAVSLAQPANSGGLNDLKFFTYDSLYFIWEFYTVAVEELIFTTVSGIVAVSLVGFILIEHRSATAFVLPMILLLYVDLLGTLQFAGLYINVVTYVCMVISIGLLVDFLMHIVLRYYESSGTTREEKVIETLETMGASILVGGLSTFLGVIPLAFSTSAILRTVFTAFFAMVTLGLMHGLVFLPVILSLWGPIVCIHSHDNKDRSVAIDDLEVSKSLSKSFSVKTAKLGGNRAYQPFYSSSESESESECASRTSLDAIAVAKSSGEDYAQAIEVGIASDESDSHSFKTARETFFETATVSLEITDNKTATETANDGSTIFFETNENKTVTLQCTDLVEC